MQSKSPLSVLIHTQAAIYGERNALLFRDDAEKVWKPISWNAFSRTVSCVSNALLALGVGIQENVAVFSQNMPQCLFVDFGAYGIRAVTIPLYATSSERQVQYVVSDANIRFIFVGEQYQYDTAYRVLRLSPNVVRLVIFDPSVKKDSQDQMSLSFEEFLKMGEGQPYAEEVARRSAQYDIDELANVLYTSGTTGLSKGVMITHRMYRSGIAAHEHAINLSEKDVVMDFLPFTHIFERAWSYLCLATGCTLHDRGAPYLHVCRAQILGKGVCGCAEQDGTEQSRAADAVAGRPPYREGVQCGLPDAGAGAARDTENALPLL